jgi:hypothetical protein
MRGEGFGALAAGQISLLAADDRDLPAEPRGRPAYPQWNDPIFQTHHICMIVGGSKRSCR